MAEKNKDITRVTTRQKATAGQSQPRSKTMKKTIFILIVFLTFMTVSGCGLVESRVARFTTDLQVLSSDNRILYEKGAEALAGETEKHLSQAMKTVESRQFGAFKEPVKIYVFATPKSFSKYSGVSEALLGAGLKSEVFLSGKLLSEINKVQGILTHELSHVQLSQKLGVIRFNRSLPRWFREGLAIYVADGGGASYATQAETTEKFLEGKHFVPETEGTLFNIKLAATGNLEPKIFYRQSGMFVQFLAQHYPLQFETFVRNLQVGKNFESQFSECFKCNVNAMLQSFIGTLRRT